MHAGQAMDGGIDRIHRAVADAGVGDISPLLSLRLHGAVANRVRAAGALAAPTQFPDGVRRYVQLLVDQGFDVLVEDFLFLVGQGLEASNAGSSCSSLNV